jgi:hypothetical protein
MTNYKLLPFLLSISFASIPIASAHTVKISGDIGGTIHIEPNDNPRAGEPAPTWFALTRKGGKVVPLKECDCQLAVYAEPHEPGEPALLKPPLKPVDAEIYELQLSGKPVIAESFRPFELKFQVTVAAGKATTPQVVENATEDNQQNNQQNSQKQAEAISLVQPIIIGAIFLLSLGIVVFFIKNR